MVSGEILGLGSELWAFLCRILWGFIIDNLLLTIYNLELSLMVIAVWGIVNGQRDAG